MPRAHTWPCFPIKVLVKDARGIRELQYGGQRPLWLGRDPGCDIPLLTQRCSARHACILFEGGKLIVRDSDSQHGTAVNEARVLNAELNENDVIRIGGATVVLQSMTEAEAIAEEVDSPEESSQGAIDEAIADTADGVAVEPAMVPPRRGRRRGMRRKAGKARRPSAPVRARATRSRSVFMNTTLIIVAVIVVGGGALALFPDLWKANHTSVTGVAPGEAGESPGLTVTPLDDQSVPGTGNASDTTTTKLIQIERSPTELLSEIRLEAEKGDLGWDLVEQLENFISTYPNHEDTHDVRKLVALLKGTRSGADRAARSAADRIVDRLTAEGRYGDAAAAARFAGLVHDDPSSRNHWDQKVNEIDGIARKRFKALEAEMNTLIEKGKTGAALRSLAQARNQFATMKFFDSLLDARIDQVLSPVDGKPDSRPLSPQAAQLKENAGIAFDQGNFRQLAEIYQSLLALDPSPEERLRILEGLVEAHNFSRMLDDFISVVAKSPVEVPNLEGYPGRITRAALKEFEFELDIGGRKGAAKGKREWARLTPAAKLALFDTLPGPSMSHEGLLGLAAFAFRTGEEAAGQHALLRLFKRSGAQDLASSVLARHLGIPVPKDGFVEFEGNLVTPVARAAELDRRKKADEEQKLARAELQRLKKEDRLASFIEQAKRLRQQGSFTIAQALLTEVVRRFPASVQGKQAALLLEDPILAVVPLAQNGPAKNRLEFYVLADGYPAEDAYQAAFVVSANTAMKLVTKEDPYKEYFSYFNFYAVELASRDRGLTRLPGGQEKDTAVGGKVTYDVFTADHARAKAILARASPGGRGGQAIVIGNDFAGVSTGGGGVSSVCKASLGALGHEIGHALGGLRDEYDVEPGMDPNRKASPKRQADLPTSPMPPNLMAGGNRDDIVQHALWKNWIDAGPDAWWNGSKVAAFEGADRQMFNVWRPQSSCKMRDSTGFCVVCMEVMVKAIYRSVRPIDRADPEGGEVLLKNGEEKEVRIWPMRPETHLLDVKWYLEPLASEEAPRKGPTVVVEKHDEERHKSYGRRIDSDGRVVDFALLRAKDLTRSKRFRLRVEVHDPIKWVLRDDEGLLTEKREWIVKVGE